MVAPTDFCLMSCFILVGRMKHPGIGGNVPKDTNDQSEAHHYIA